ncbi:Acylphosphatase [Amniculicola lignicola CBS 123094]|uniref:acylphosphatase n=1 Tax=Amniculicola lignicola CBS 123094 TaxID=1392246 RepID=A0A6A5WKB4_9PLEO|nr:Acylphosphatase [Amniculicola lignicola CBS 123094]
MSAKRISYKVKGEVQGKYHTVKQAQKIGVTGFVKNLSDGSVQGEAQGSEDALKEFVSHLHKGPPAASVSDVEHSEMSSKAGESGFRVK